MKRALLVSILTLSAAAAACASRTATYSGDTTGRAARDAARRSAVRPSDLSPEQVRLVQRSLIDRGFAVDPTGAFDDRTRSALMDFQRARGLSATASLDRPTVDALGLDPRDVLPVRGTAPDRTGRSGEEHEGQTPGVHPYDPSSSGQPDSSHPGTERGDGADR